MQQILTRINELQGKYDIFRNLSYVVKIKDLNDIIIIYLLNTYIMIYYLLLNVKTTAGAYIYI